MHKIKLNCSGCSRNIESTNKAVKFSCPNCGEFELWRCERCRKFSRTYKCPSCDFIGP